MKTNPVYPDYPCERNAGWAEAAWPQPINAEPINPDGLRCAPPSYDYIH